MQDQYFGIKELYEVVLKAKVPMTFGNRELETGEPVLYFENVSLGLLTENATPIMARGGWSNMPRVIWEDRSEVRFSLSEGVLSATSMGILFNSLVLAKKPNEVLYVPKREGPYAPDKNGRIFLAHWPVGHKIKKTFIYEYARDVAQKKIYGERVNGLVSSLTGEERPCIKLYKDREHTQEADLDKEYIVDYYFEYTDDALVYLIQKERFNGLFSLEGKFYTKDENDGLNYTNLIYMPKVRIVSDINLRLGERANPTVGTFNIIGMPESTNESRNLIVKIEHLNSDIE